MQKKATESEVTMQEQSQMLAKALALRRGSVPGITLLSMRPSIMVEQLFLPQPPLTWELPQKLA
jgi:hypothetical protein